MQVIIVYIYHGLLICLWKDKIQTLIHLFRPWTLLSPSPRLHFRHWGFKEPAFSTGACQSDGPPHPSTWKAEREGSLWEGRGWEHRPWPPRTGLWKNKCGRSSLASMHAGLWEFRKLLQNQPPGPKGPGWRWQPWQPRGLAWRVCGAVSQLRWWESLPGFKASGSRSHMRLNPQHGLSPGQLLKVISLVNPSARRTSWVRGVGLPADLRGHWGEAWASPAQNGHTSTSTCPWTSSGGSTRHTRQNVYETQPAPPPPAVRALLLRVHHCSKGSEHRWKLTGSLGPRPLPGDEIKNLKKKQNQEVSLLRLKGTF